MFEPPTPGKFARWKRPILSGILSASIAGVFFFGLLAMNQGYYISGNYKILNLITYIAGVGFAAPAVLVLGINFQSIALASTIILLFWFLVGVLIGKHTKTNLLAIVFWFFIYLVCVFTALGQGLLSQ